MISAMRSSVGKSHKSSPGDYEPQPRDSRRVIFVCFSTDRIPVWTRRATSRDQTCWHPPPSLLSERWRYQYRSGIGCRTVGHNRATQTMTPSKA